MWPSSFILLLSIITVAPLSSWSSRKPSIIFLHDQLSQYLLLFAHPSYSDHIPIMWPPPFVALSVIFSSSALLPAFGTEDSSTASFTDAWGRSPSISRFLSRSLRPTLEVTNASLGKTAYISRTAWRHHVIDRHKRFLLISMSMSFATIVTSCLPV